MGETIPYTKSGGSIFSETVVHLSPYCRVLHIVTGTQEHKIRQLKHKFRSSYVISFFDDRQRGRRDLWNLYYGNKQLHPFYVKSGRRTPKSDLTRVNHSGNQKDLTSRTDTEVIWEPVLWDWLFSPSSLKVITLKKDSRTPCPVFLCTVQLVEGYSRSIRPKTT